MTPAQAKKLALHVLEQMHWDPLNIDQLKTQYGRQWDVEFSKTTIPPLCEGCEINRADPPSKLCPGCQAYQEHQQ